MNRLDFKLNTAVYGYAHKEYGSLAKIVLHPTTRQVTALIVSRGLLSKQAWVIPIAKMAHIQSQAIHLALDEEAFKSFPQYQKFVQAKGEPAWQEPLTELGTLPYIQRSALEMPVTQEAVRTGVADEMILLDGNTAVAGLKTKIGALSRVLTDAQFQLTHLVVSHGSLLPKQLLIPVQLVESIGERRIQITATAADVAEFSEFVQLNGEPLNNEAETEPPAPEDTEETAVATQQKRES